MFLFFRSALAPVLLLAVGAATAAPPVARISPVTDTYFGEQVKDRYRWMENAHDPDWLPFMQGQHAHARATLSSLPQRAQLLARIRQLSGDAATPASIARAGGRTFFELRPAGGDHYQLFVQDGGQRRLLVDPGRPAGAEGRFSLDWWSASPDGARVAYGLSRDGSEDSVLHIVDVATGEVLPDRIADTQIAYPSWLPDGSGFFYNQLSGKAGTPERYLDARARLHLLGADPATDPIVAAASLRQGGVAFASSQLPFVFASPGSRHALLVLSDERREKRILVAPLQDVVAARPAGRRSTAPTRSSCRPTARTAIRLICRPSRAASWPWPTPAPSSASPTCAAAESMGATGTALASWPTSRTPGAT